MKVKKLLIGRDLKAGKFEFELKGTEDNVHQVKKNAVNGDVIFDTIEYTKVGTYHYMITEKDTKLQGVIYDKKVIKVTVTVTDNSSRILETKGRYDQDVKAFENSYTLPATPPKKGLPKTGTAVHYLAIFMDMILLVGAVYFIKKKISLEVEA